MATDTTRAAAGTKFSIASGAPATYDAAGFAAQTYKNIGRIQNGGEFDKQFEIITANFLDRRGTLKRKGTWDAGDLSLEVALATDEGQTLCETAMDSDDDYSIKVSLSNGVVYYLRGIVTAFRTRVGGPNDLLTATITIGLNPIPATGGDVAGIKVAS